MTRSTVTRFSSRSPLFRQEVTCDPRVKYLAIPSAAASLCSVVSLLLRSPLLINSLSVTRAAANLRTPSVAVCDADLSRSPLQNPQESSENIAKHSET